MQYTATYAGFLPIMHQWIWLTPISSAIYSELAFFHMFVYLQLQPFYYLLFKCDETSQVGELECVEQNNRATFFIMSVISLIWLHNMQKIGKKLPI